MNGAEVTSFWMKLRQNYLLDILQTENEDTQETRSYFHGAEESLYGSETFSVEVIEDTSTVRGIRSFKFLKKKS